MAKVRSETPVNPLPATPQDRGGTAVARSADREPASRPDDREQAANAEDRGRIASRAYELYMARGGADGQDLEDWLEAERELGRQRGDRDQDR